MTRLTTHRREPLADLLRAVPEFTPEEVTVALELADQALEASGDGDSDGYRFLLALEDERVTGYVCYGKTPMTAGTFDLYWLAVHPAHRRRGVAQRLVRAMEEELLREGALLVRVETSSAAAYDATRAFYDRVGFERAGLLRDFYKAGNDLVIFAHRLRPAKTGV